MAKRITNTENISIYSGMPRTLDNRHKIGFTQDSDKTHPIYGPYVGKLMEYEHNGTRTYGRVGDILNGFIEFDQVIIFSPRTNKMEVSDRIPVRIPMLGVPRPINQNTLADFATEFNLGKEKREKAETKWKDNQQP
jgi:hypothetical protein